MGKKSGGVSGFAGFYFLIWVEVAHIQCDGQSH